MEHVRDMLQANRYPGRGVVWARTRSGTLCGGYFLAGRSPASRARALIRGQDEIIVASTDQTAPDPLRHYAANREQGCWLVFGNGEQVATVHERLQRNLTPAAALDDLDYEPDSPIFTPRITVIADLQSPGIVWFGAARHSLSNRSATNRLTLSAADLTPGDAVLITTYASDGTRVATGAPVHEAQIEAADESELLDELWNALDPGLRVAAVAFQPGQLVDARTRQKHYSTA